VKRATTAAVLLLTFLVVLGAGFSKQVVLAGRSKLPEASAGPGCGFAPALRPKVFVLACATGNDQLVNIVWNKWSSSVGKGLGENTYNACQPDCASSPTWITTRAQVEVTNVVPTPGGRFFSELRWRDASSAACALAPGGCWQRWQEESVPVSTEYYHTGTACHAAWIGLASDGWYGTLVWCERIGSRSEWVHMSQSP
jgi:hypothetical protein